MGRRFKEEENEFGLGHVAFEEPVEHQSPAVFVGICEYVSGAQERKLSAD